MKKFILLYKGPATPPGASHEKWPPWFNKVGDKLVDKGSPMDNGLVLHRDGSKSDTATDFNGYSIIQAENINDAISLGFIKQLFPSPARSSTRPAGE